MYNQSFNNTSNPCAILKVYLWNGADTDWRGSLVYKALLQDAIQCNVGGGTVWRTVEGSRASRVFRTVESEVISNELPVCLEFIDSLKTIEAFIPRCQKRVNTKGVIVVERGYTWKMNGHGKEGGGPMNLRDDGTNERPERTIQAAYDGLQVQIFTLEQNKVDGKPLYQGVAELLRNRDILWISTSRGISGFGEGRQIRQRGFWFRKNDVPIMMTILDKVEKLEACIPDLVSYVGNEGFLVTKPVMWHWPR